MSRSRTVQTSIVLLLTLFGVSALVVSTRPTAGAGAAAEGPYGFRNQEIYKLDRGAYGLQSADFNGDGRQDLVLINNAKARIDVYVRRETPAAEKTDDGADARVNDLPDDKQFERKERLTEKSVGSLAVGDLDGDGKVDIAYYGKPLELVVAYGDGKGGFDRERAMAVTDGLLYRSCLVAGDLNADGRTDLALLTKNQVKVWTQGADGTLGEPESIAHAAKEPNGIALRDLDGNGRPDLVIFSPNEARSLRVRFQADGGELGPETAFKLPPVRTIDFLDIDPRPGVEVVAVQRSSGLLRALGLARTPSGDGTGIPLASVRVHPYPARSGKRKLALGDVDGDGKTDVVMTAPKTAQVVLRVQAKGRLGGSRFFPSLSEADELRVADVTGDARCEVIVLSRKEKSIAWAGLDDDGRLPFPTSLAVEGNPKALEVADIDGDGRPEIVVLSHGSANTWFVTSFAPDEAGKKLVASRVIPLGELPRAEPEEFLATDLDRDGRAELIAIDRYKTMVWRQDDKGALVLLSDAETFNLGLIAGKKRAELHVVDLDGDGRTELAVASANFARIVGIDETGALRVSDQVNARSDASRIEGMVVVDLDGTGGPEVALLDADGDQVTVLRRGSTGTFSVAANFPLGDFKFQRLEAADLNGDGRADLVVVGAEKFGVLTAGADDLELRELATFESPIRDALIDNFTAGDLNKNGRPDLVLLETRSHMMEIVDYRAKEGFVHRLKWRVFEQKGHGNTRVSRGEPREVVAADFDGDGAVDLAILVHDRLIVYPQD